MLHKNKRWHTKLLDLSSPSFRQTALWTMKQKRKVNQHH